MPNEPQSSENEIPEKIQEVKIITEKDPFLQDLVDNVNLFTENKIGITLQMSGLLVTGIMIPGDRYYELIAQEMSNEEEVRTSIRNWGDRYIKSREIGSIEIDSDTTFIHLENCTFHTSTQIVKSAVVWRGRISEVQGFFTGSIGIVKD
jgi:hypothetical protein